LYLLLTTPNNSRPQVFAPINEAFASVPEKYLTEEWNSHLTDILLYHVISGEVLSTDLTFNMTVETLNGESVTVTSYPAPVQINGVEVILADVAASNGVIHVVDEVLLPSSATNTIVDIAVSTPALSTLVDLVTAAGLVDTLNSEGPFTVFAPTNEAFNKLDSTVVETLTNPDNVDDLTDVLTYHVVAGIVLSSELSVGDELTAANGDILTVTSIDPPTINDSIVLVGDILANNGVVHTIDTALIPP
jgi:transforming growth factor-beta-induced protein